MGSRCVAASYGKTCRCCSEDLFVFVLISMADIFVVFDWIVSAVGFLIGLLPWFALFLCQWKRSLFAMQWLDEVIGREHNTPGLQGKLKYLVLPGALSLWMNVVLFITMIPSQMLSWTSFPRFCIVPRTAGGLLQLHQAVFHHFGFTHYAMNNFALWTLGPLVLSYNRRIFTASLFFIGIVGNIFLWLFGPNATCTAGFSGVIFGWFGLLSAGLFLECPPRWWRVLLLIIVGFFLGATFYDEVFSGDDDEGVSWHGHAIGFFCGLVFAYLRFRRNWFLCEGLEDRVRPCDGSKPTFCTSVRRLGTETRLGMRAACTDIARIFTCKGPLVNDTVVGQESADNPPQAYGSRTEGTGV